MHTPKESPSRTERNHAGSGRGGAHDSAADIPAFMVPGARAWSLYAVPTLNATMTGTLANALFENEAMN